MDKRLILRITFLLISAGLLAITFQQMALADELPPNPAPGSGSASGSEESGSVSYGNECSGCGGTNLVTETPPYKEESVEVTLNQGESGVINIQGTPYCTPLGGSPEEQAAAGAEGLMGNDCSWVCDDERINFSYSPITNSWSASSVTGNSNNGGVLGNTDGFSLPNDNYDNLLDWLFAANAGGLSEVGLPTCGEWTGESTRETIERICWKELVINGGTSITPGGNGQTGTFVCAGNYDVQASASIPCPAVQRWPYPRGIVNAPIEFLISGNGAVASDDSRYWCEPHIMNYTIAVGWDQLPIPPLWHWDERPWSDQPQATMGYHVFHTYDTASFGKLENGPDTRGEMDHPAYQVKVETYWVPWVQESWDEWAYEDWDCERVVVGQQYDPATGEYEDIKEWQGPECQQRQQCLNRGIEPYPNSSECGEWHERGSGRITIDLLEFGFPAPYVMFFDAQDVTQPPPGLPDPQPRQCNLPVPVIESQGLLTVPSIP